MTTQRYCTLCRFYQGGAIPRCGHKNAVRDPDPTNGMAQQNWSCETARMYGAILCGPEGQWFEPNNDKAQAA